MKNPFLSAASAAAYIGAVALFLHFISTARHDTPDTLLDSMGFLSLFVLSATVMAFLFFYQPVTLLIENKKKQAISYFLQTLGAFGVLTVAVLIFVSVQ